jgi:hypothetical protein
VDSPGAAQSTDDDDASECPEIGRTLVDVHGHEELGELPPVPQAHAQRLPVGSLAGPVVPVEADVAPGIEITERAQRLHGGARAVASEDPAPRIEVGLGGDRPVETDPEDGPPRDLGARRSWTGCSAPGRRPASTRDCPGRRHRAAGGHARRAARRVHRDGHWPQAHRRDAPALAGGGQRDPPGGSPTRTAPVPQRPNSAWSGGSSVTSNDQLLNLLNEHPGVRDALHHGIALNRGVASPSRPR